MSGYWYDDDWDDHHPACRGGCGQLADECECPMPNPLGSMRITTPEEAASHTGRGRVVSELVPPEEVERIVGARRHPTMHLGRADSSEQTVYILHSALCKASGIDLRQCSFSRILDRGIDLAVWQGWEDRAVVLGSDGTGRLIPLSRTLLRTRHE